MTAKLTDIIASVVETHTNVCRRAPMFHSLVEAIVPQLECSKETERNKRFGMEMIDLMV